MFYSFTVDKSRLVNGTNVIAVEIHQANRTSTDVSFDLGLISTAPPPAPVESVLVNTGATWKYLDTGGDQGSAGGVSGFNDSLWKTGRHNSAMARGMKRPSFRMEAM